jgi:hypothetical protein
MSSIIATPTLRPPSLISSFVVFAYICAETAEIEAFDSARQSLPRAECLMDDIGRLAAGSASGPVGSPPAMQRDGQADDDGGGAR